METTTNNQVAIIENSIKILRSAPEILQSNQVRKDKALMVGNNILQAIEEHGMNAETDQRCNNYLANIIKARKEMNESRSSVTQIMDNLKSMYTEVENVLDVKKAGTIPYLIQEHRNNYAKELAEEAERKQRDAERAAAKAKEAIDLKTYFVTELSKAFNNYLLGKKQKLQQKFNELTLDTFADDAAAIRQYQTNLTESQFNTLRVVPPTAFYHTPQESTELYAEATNGKQQQFASIYAAEMLALSSDIVDKLKSKREELLEQKRLADEAAEAAEQARLAEEERQKKIAAANTAEKKRLEEEARIQKQKDEEILAQARAEIARLEEDKKRREQEEAERMKKEAAAAQWKAEQEAEIKRQGEQTLVLFEQEAALATETPSPEVRQGYEIEVLHPVGWTQIFACWFENEGKNLPSYKIGNMKLDQMKAWCEKHAHKNNVKIESRFLKYRESYRAVNKSKK